MKNIACLLSYVLHPLLMPMYVLFLAFHIESLLLFSPQIQTISYEITFLVSVVLPLLSLFLFKRFRLISDYGLDVKQERVYPILAVVVGMFLGFWLVNFAGPSGFVLQLYLIIIILLSGFSVITLRWKMSMHMMAIGGVCGLLLILGIKYFGEVRYPLMLMFVLSGLLAMSRLYLGKHTPSQIYVGFLYGLFFVAAILYWRP